MKKIILVGVAVLALAFVLSNQSSSDTKILRIGTEAAYMPWNGTDTDGNIVGFDVDVANALCDTLDKKCVFVKQDWDGIIPALINKKYDAIISSMTITQKRRASIAFTDGYADTGVSVASTNPAKFKTEQEMIAGLKGKIIGVQTGTISALYAEKAFKNATVRMYATQDELNIDLLSQRIDFGMNDHSAWVDLQKGNNNVTVVSPIFTGKDNAVFGEGIGIGLRKDNVQLQQELNNALNALRENGTLKKISIKWFGFDASL